MSAAGGTLHDVPYGEVSPPPAGAAAISDLGFDETLERLRHVFNQRDLWLIHEIDPQMLLARDGRGIGKARQLLFFHPRYAVRLLEANPAALIEIPMKIAVLELPDGRVLVRQSDIETDLRRYAGMETLASELGALMRDVMASLHAVKLP